MLKEGHQRNTGYNPEWIIHAAWVMEIATCFLGIICGLRLLQTKISRLPAFEYIISFCTEAAAEISGSKFIHCKHYSVHSCSTFPYWKKNGTKASRYVEDVSYTVCLYVEIGVFEFNYSNLNDVNCERIKKINARKKGWVQYSKTISVFQFTVCKKRCAWIMWIISILNKAIPSI